MKRKPRKILVYRLGSLGDTCVALPSLRVVRESAPAAHVTLLTNLPVSGKAAPCAELLEGMGLVDEFLSYPIGTRNTLRIAALLLTLRRARFDWVVNLAAWRGRAALLRDSLFFRMASGGCQIGFAPGLGHELRWTKAGESEAEARRLLRRVASLGTADLTERRWSDLSLSEEELRSARRRLGKAGIDDGYMVCCVGSKAQANDWGQDNWMRLIGVLRSANDRIGCVFIGAADEAERAECCLARWNGPKLNLCGISRVRESGAVLAGARVFVGHDSGPMHLAAAAGTSCVAIFSARNHPGQWFPMGKGHQVFYRHEPCQGCGLDVCEKEKQKCILGITVEEVAAAVRLRLVLTQGTARTEVGEGGCRAR